MELITWYEKYSVNNEVFDNHHKELFYLINNLFDSYMANNIANNYAQDLVSMAKLHISAEEHYMRSIGYEDINEHIYENKIFIQKTLQLQQAVNNDDYELTRRLIEYLGYWLLNHVMVNDRKFAI